MKPIVSNGEEAAQFVMDLYEGHRIRKTEVRDFAGQVNALFAALRVLTDTPHIRAYLEANDPKALEQAQRAMTVPE